MPQYDRFADEFRDRHPHPGDDPIARLRHTVDVFANSSSDEQIVVATAGVYGDAVTTGLTHGDLRAIVALLDRAGVS